MRTKALISSILLGTLSLAGVASADPFVRDHRVQPTITVQPAVSLQANFQARYRAPIVVDHRYNTQPTTYGFQVSSNGQYVEPYTYGNDPYVEGIARGEWYSLAAGVRLAYNTNSATNIDLGGQRLRSLELQATGGRNFIGQVRVDLMDGRQITLNTNRTLDVVTGPNMRLDLGPQASCGIRRIEVIGWSSGKGQFRVLGA
jgi:hypothetical protein